MPSWINRSRGIAGLHQQTTAAKPFDRSIRASHRLRTHIRTGFDTYPLIKRNNKSQSTESASSHQSLIFLALLAPGCRMVWTQADDRMERRQSAPARPHPLARSLHDLVVFLVRPPVIRLRLLVRLHYQARSLPLQKRANTPPSSGRAFIHGRRPWLSPAAVAGAVQNRHTHTK